MRNYDYPPLYGGLPMRQPALETLGLVGLKRGSQFMAYYSPDSGYTTAYVVGANPSTYYSELV